MTEVDDPFQIRAREGVGVLFGLAGPTGSGKTLTALRLARGLAALPGEDLNDPVTLMKVDERIAFGDTESRRALHYYCGPGQMPTPFQPGRGATFRFKHAEIHPPFQPEAYQNLIHAADKRGYAVTIIDSWSHEWDGEGGLTEIHADVLERLLEQGRERASKSNGGSLPQWWRDDQQRDKLSITAWKEPKVRNKHLVNRMLQCRSHIIVCMRAEDKLRIETEKETRTKRNGDEYEVTKTKVTPPKDLPPGQRWVPICEKRLPFEFTVGITLTPEEPGRPYAMKTIPEKLRPIFDPIMEGGGRIDEQTGVLLAAWARGEDSLSRSGPLRIETRQDEAGHGAPADDFPGDRSATADPYSDAPPGDAVWLGADWFSPGKPVALPCKAEMAKQSWQQWIKAFRDLTAAAPSTDVARQWKAKNAEPLLRLKATSPVGYAGAVENCPPDVDQTADAAQSPPLTGTGDF